MKKYFEIAMRVLFLIVFVLAQTPALAASASPMSNQSGSAFIFAQAGIGQRQIPSAPGPAPAEKYSILPQETFAPREPASYAVSNPISVGNAPAASGSKPDMSMFRSQNIAPPPPPPVSAGGLSITPITAYNLIVDSNVLAPSSYGPSAATIGAKFCNTNASGQLDNVWAYVGDRLSNTPGTYPVMNSTTYGNYDTDGVYPNTFAQAFPDLANEAQTTGTDYGDTARRYALEQEAGSVQDNVDASRFIGTIPAGTCHTEYWLVSYPRKAMINSDWVDVTGDVKPDDDLWLPYDFWAVSGANTAYVRRYVTMRNEISAMANKIWPNGDNKVPDQYISAIQQVLGWDTWTPSDPSGATHAFPGEVVTSQGIWYDFGVVGAGFDNNGDLVPDRNAWVQPIGDASVYDPGCFNLVRTYGLLIVKLNDGNDLLIPFKDQMYFENLPANNTGVVGLVFYEYMAMDGACSASLTPYQEVASGDDNEKFNADFGAGIPPLQSQEPDMTFVKSGPNTIAINGTITYSLTFTLPDISTSNNLTVTIGNASTGDTLTYYDAVPVGLTYVGDSATDTVDMNIPADIPATIMHSIDGGATWIVGDRLTNYTSTSTSDQLILQWRLSQGVTSPSSGAAYTGTVTFSAIPPGGPTPPAYTSKIIENTACLKIGDGDPFLCSPHITVLSGDSAITGVAFKDDGISGGTANDGVQTGTEAGIGDTNSNGTGVTVKLYWDGNGDGDYADAGDFLYGTTTTNSSGAYCFGGSLVGLTCTPSNTNGLPATSAGDSTDDVANITGVYDVIDGFLDVNPATPNGIIDGNDDLTNISGTIDVIDGLLDMDNDGVTAGDDGDDGSLFGYTVINGYLDIDGDGTVGSRYIIVVDPADDDIPTGYGPTTTTSYTGVSVPASSLYGDAALPNEPSDFGFAPALSVEKWRTSASPVTEGQTVQFTLSATNTLPGSGSSGSACSYYVYAREAYPTTWTGAPDGGGPPNAQFQLPLNAIGQPDERYSYSTMSDNTDTIGLGGMNIGNMGGNITSVQMVVNVHERTIMDASDSLAVYIYYGDASVEEIRYFGDGNWELNDVAQVVGPVFATGGTGSEWIITRTLQPSDVGLAAWSWGNFSGAAGMEMLIEANKGSATTGDIDLDAAGFIITTDGSCGSSSTVLNPVPLIDHYDNRYLQFVSSVPPITGTSATADPNITQLSWANVGPIYPGDTTHVTVTFLAKNVTTSTTTINKDESTGAKFASGTPANSDLMTVPNDSTNNNWANVTIDPAGSISGYLWSDSDNDGWVGTTGYETGEPFIPGMTLQLYGCYTTSPLAGGSLITSPSNKSCDQQGNPDNWFAVPGATATTDSNGYYKFDLLPPGYYYVQVTSTPPGTQTAEPVQTGTNNGQSCTGAACDLIWQPDTANTVADEILTSGNFNNLTTGEEITNVNWGFRPTMIYGTIWQDYDGDGVRDPGDPGLDNGVLGVTVTLYDCGLIQACSFPTLVSTTNTDTSGYYQFLGLTATHYYRVVVNTGTLPTGTWTNTDEAAPAGSTGVATQGTTGDSVIVTTALTTGLVSGGYDFGYHTGAYVIGDTLYYDWNGNGDQDASDEGIRNVDVELYRDLDNDGVIDSTDPLIGSTFTNDNGIYCFGGSIVNDVCTPGTGALRDGTYIVKVITSDTSFPTNVVQVHDPNEFHTIVNGYFDLNGGGISTTDDGMLAGVNIIDGAVDLNGSGTITAADSGTFLNYPLYSGRLDVNASLTGDDNDDDTIYVCIVCDSMSKVTIVSASNTDQDFGYQPKGSGSIGDTVFKDINGNGLQSITEPGISGVTVELQVDMNNDGNWVTIAYKATDANGNYLFTGLGAGTYRVKIDLDNTPYANATAIPNDPYGNDYLPSNGTTTTPGMVYVEKTLVTNTSSDLTADFGFAPPAFIGDTVYSDVNRNGTQDLTEPGINGVTVNLYTFVDSGDGDGVYDEGEPYYDLDGDNVRDTNEPFFDRDGRYQPGETINPTLVATTTTYSTVDHQGYYQFDGLAPGYYLVEAVYAGEQTGDPNADGVSCDNITYQVRMLNADADKGSICDERDGMRLYNGTSYTGADFGYQVSTGSIGDTIWIDSDNDGIRDPSESGIDQVTVFICATSPCDSGNAITSVETDSDGYYLFTGLGAGTYFVAVDSTDPNLTALGMSPSFERNDTTPDGEAKVTLSDIGSGVIRVTNINDNPTDCTNCDLDVDFAYRVDGNTTLSGTICLDSSTDGTCGTDNTDTSGTGTGETPYNNVVVYLYMLNDLDDDGVLDPGETTVQVGTTTTNASGDFSFTDLQDGVYYIIAIGAPQDGLDLTSTETAVNTGNSTDDGDADDDTTDYVENSALDNDTLTVYQVVKVDANDTSVVDRDFAFKLNGSFDFGDLPQEGIYDYSTTLQGVPDGPRHQRPTSGSYSLYLGTAPDIETNGQPNLTASGDGGDEDGVSVPAVARNDSWNDVDGGTLQFTSTGSGWLVGWMDLNLDGDFADANEMIVSRALSAGTTSVNITTLSGLVDGTYYSRFRLFTSEPPLAELAYTGSTLDGEVEDYRIIVRNGGPTPITVAYITANREGDTVTFEWNTSTEIGNVGFNLYGSGKDGLALLNTQLIPSNAVDSLTRQDYTFSAQMTGNMYFLEEVSVLGVKNLHGPYVIGEAYGSLVEEETIDWPAIQAEYQANLASNQNRLKPGLQAAENAPSVLNLKVNKTGIYRVTYEMLRDAGLDLAATSPRDIRLTNNGQMVPIYVKASTRFGAGSYFEFYGQALDTIYTDTNIYTVQVVKATNKRITSIATAPSRTITPPVSFNDTLTVNNQRSYASFYALEDGWYDTSMLAYKTPLTWHYPFSVNLANTTAATTLDLTVWGVTDWPGTLADHHLIVSINGVQVADETFNGLVVKKIQVTIPAGVLKSGENSLDLTIPGDTGVNYDMINLDKFSVGYPRSFQAQDGRLTFTSPGKVFKVTNLPTKNVTVYRLDKNGPVRVNTVQIQSAGTTYNATFAGLTNGAAATYVVTAAESMYAPTLEVARVPSNLNTPAQYLVIAHPNFISGMQPIVQARQAQGLTVNVVDVYDVYAQYSYGVIDAQAIRQYIAYAQQNLGTQYVLLVGGDTYDYRNYLGRNSISFIPSLYADTGTARLVPVDPLFADGNGDNIPDVAIGRFPVRTSAELTLMVNKTLAYGQKTYGKTAMFAADAFDGTIDFKNINLSMIATLPSGWTVESVTLDDLAVATAQTQLLAAMNRGTALITFTGHSSPTTWTYSGLFNTTKASQLTNANKPFVAVQWGCWNIYHVDPTSSYLVQSLLFSGDKGAAALFGASTLTDSESEELLGYLLTSRLVQPGMTIGQALQQSKSELAQTHPELLDVLLGWSLMGDPALVIEP